MRARKAEDTEAAVAAAEHRRADRQAGPGSIAV